MPPGNVQRQMYRPTKGLEHDVTAPLERVVAGSTSVQEPPQAKSIKDTSEQDADLGTLQFFGLPAKGTRQAFQDSNGKPTHTLDTWFNASLGLTVHTESRNARGDTVVSDLSELHLDSSVSPSAGTAPVAAPAIPLLALYRVLFTQIAHMERDRLANDPNFHVNMDEIEDHLRKKMSLTATDWQTLVDKSVKVESYTREVSKQARSVAAQQRAARRENPLSADTLAGRSATLHKMQQDFNLHVQGEIDQLKANVGPDASDRIQAYLQGPVAASTSIIHVQSAQSQAQRAAKEQAR